MPPTFPVSKSSKYEIYIYIYILYTTEGQGENKKNYKITSQLQSRMRGNRKYGLTLWVVGTLV